MGSGRLISGNLKTEPALLRAGWVCILVGLFWPFCVSLFAAYQLRDLECTGDLAWTMAPLLFTCGEQTTAALVFGWAGTVLSMSCLLIAVIIALVAVFGAAARRTVHGLRSASRHFALTVAATAIACCAVLLSRPDELWGTGSWLLFTTGVGLLVCTAGGTLRIVLNARASH